MGSRLLAGLPGPLRYPSADHVKLTLGFLAVVVR